MTPTVTPYNPAKFLVGSSVRIKPRAELETFQREWKHHHPLQGDQLSYAGHTATVKAAGMYHGGDVLYQLSDIPGTWHEVCLEVSESSHAV